MPLLALGGMSTAAVGRASGECGWAARGVRRGQVVREASMMRKLVVLAALCPVPAISRSPREGRRGRQAGSGSDRDGPRAGHLGQRRASPWARGPGRNGLLCRGLGVLRDLRALPTRRAADLVRRLPELPP